MSEKIKKSLLAGNGINIQFDSESYSPVQIVLRILKNLNRKDFPKHIIVDFHSRFSVSAGKLYWQTVSAK